MTPVHCMVFILMQVHPSSLLFLCICYMITAQNLITVCQSYLSEFTPVVVLDQNSHSGMEIHTTIT